MKNSFWLHRQIHNFWLTWLRKRVMHKSFPLNSLLRVRLKPLTVWFVCQMRRNFAEKNNLGDSSWALVINNLTKSIEKSYSCIFFSYAERNFFCANRSSPDEIHQKEWISDSASSWWCAKRKRNTIALREEFRDVRQSECYTHLKISFQI